MIRYEGLVELGTLKKGDVELQRPNKPWFDKWIDNEKVYGDIHIFDNANDKMSDYNITDTSPIYDNKILWNNFTYRDQEILICDRNILVDVSWVDLNNAGYINGKMITIDGDKYLCSLLTSDMDSGIKYEKSPVNRFKNEWDMFIDQHEQLSWYNDDCYSWCINNIRHFKHCKVLRANKSFQELNWSAEDNSSFIYGWRPVLTPIK
jgi:hypothetical protein